MKCVYQIFEVNGNTVKVCGRTRTIVALNQEDADDCKAYFSGDWTVEIQEQPGQ